MWGSTQFVKSCSRKDGSNMIKKIALSFVGIRKLLCRLLRKCYQFGFNITTFQWCITWGCFKVSIILMSTTWLTLLLRLCSKCCPYFVQRTAFCQLIMKVLLLDISQRTATHKGTAPMFKVLLSIYKVLLRKFLKYCSCKALLQSTDVFK